MLEILGSPIIKFLLQKKAPIFTVNDVILQANRNGGTAFALFEWEMGKM